MNFELLGEMKKAGVTVRKFCGIELEGGVNCPLEAVGELKIMTEEEIEIPMPVCGAHLELISKEYNIST